MKNQVINVSIESGSFIGIMAFLYYVNHKFMLEHHPLIKEFPEHVEAIHSLKDSDNHFHKLFNKYDEIDKNIFRVEANQEPITDVDLENLKKERLNLKDTIYKMIVGSSKATA